MVIEGKKEKLVVGNWKMNLTINESITLAERLKKEILFSSGVETVLAPSFVGLGAVANEISGSSLEVAAQDIYFEEKGAFTGAVSPLMIRGVAKYCIVGHSERRIYFNENDKDVAKKIRVLLAHGIKPILCIGENLKEKHDGLSKVVVTSQLEGALSHISKDDLKNVAIAYEPVWAISTTKDRQDCSSEDALTIINSIRKFLKALYGEEVVEKIKILYGGSVKNGNVDEFLVDGIDGFIVGGASLDHKDFTDIVKKTYKSINS